MSAKPKQDAKVPVLKGQEGMYRIQRVFIFIFNNNCSGGQSVGIPETGIKSSFNRLNSEFCADESSLWRCGCRC